MASNKKPVKGILKSTSFDKHEPAKELNRRASKDKEMKWDEMNILATYHPADKDYGHMKIDEPPTPYSAMDEDEKSASDEDALDPKKLCKKLENAQPRRRLSSSGDEREEVLSPEEKAKREKFEQRRKMHYNEYQAVKLARQLMNEKDDEDENKPGSSKHAT